MSMTQSTIQTEQVARFPALDRATVSETVAIGSLAFIIPFVLAGPQLVVGSLVNAALIYAALNVRSSRALPVVFMPSLAVLSRGVLLGTLTPFLATMLPIIWVGNLVLVYAVKALSARRTPVWLALPVACAAKAGLLYLAAALFVRSGVLPQAMLSAMGLTQLYTALIGAAVAVAASTAIRRAVSNE